MYFTRKVRYAANGSMADTPVGLYYSSVLYRDSVIIAFLVAALNDSDIFAYNISNAYLNAPCQEIIWFVAGLKFGNILEGKVMKSVCTLNGLKSSGSIWRKMSKDPIVNFLRLIPNTIDPKMYYGRNIK